MIKYVDTQKKPIKNINRKSLSKFLDYVLNGEINENNAKNNFDHIKEDYDYIVDNPSAESKGLKRYFEESKSFIKRSSGSEEKNVEERTFESQKKSF